MKAKRRLPAAKQRLRLRPAVFLDRDGTLLYDRPGYYLRSPEKLRLYPFAAQALKALQSRGYALIIVTNQSGVGRGFLTEETLEKIHGKLQRLLRRKGVRLDGIYSCLHHPEDRCICRKPRPTLALQAVRELGLTLKGSVTVGDKKADTDLARNLKVPSVLVMTGHGRNETLRYGRRMRATFVARNLLQASRWILKNVES
jgi:D-glycero-D-manno-heptose 1,7-bisphosphate phosphatase